MKYKIKIVLPILALCMLLSACNQPSTVETQTPPPTSVETSSPTPAPTGSPAPLTLAGVEINHALFRHSYDDVPSDFDRDEDAQLEERFLTCGFTAEEPFYEFYDQKGQIEITFWYDEVNRNGIGIYYKYCVNETVLYGFGIDGALPAEDWELAEYIRWAPEHDVYESRYDDLSRPIYEEGYITHGSLRYYYIYEGESDTPKYVLFLDDGTGITPELICFYDE